MANEISLNLQLIVNNTYTNTFIESAAYTQSAIGAASGVQIATTSLTHLDLGSVSVLGYAVFKNLDSVNYVDIGIDSTGFVGMGRLLPGETCIFRFLPGVVPSLKAHTASVKVQYLLLES